MEINNGASLVMKNYPLQTTATSSADGGGNESVDVIKAELSKDKLNEGNQSNELTNDEIGQVTEELNKFMEKINTDLRFEIHEKTNRMIVQVIDSKDKSVIKEFPPHELLDTLAAISDYIGVLLDKKA